MYDSPPTDGKLYQGDILKECKFYLPALGTITASTTPRLYEGNAIILTQSCDIDDDENILLGLIEPIENFKQHLLDNEKDINTVNSLIGQLQSKRTFYKELGLFQWFYLPAYGELGESIAYLNRVGLVNKTDLPVEKRIAFLSSRARQWLQYYLMRLVGRPFYWGDP